MAEQFESTIRPFVNPSIRPSGLRSKPIGDDSSGSASIGGGSTVATRKWTRSEQASWSRSQPVETKRVVDRERVYQKKPPTPEHPKGEIEKENYVDVERIRSLTMQDGSGQLVRYDYALPSRSDNVEVLQEKVTINNPNLPSESGGAAP
jgi:hypothetical protein